MHPDALMFPWATNIIVSAARRTGRRVDRGHDEQELAAASHLAPVGDPWPNKATRCYVRWECQHALDTHLRSAAPYSAAAARLESEAASNFTCSPRRISCPAARLEWPQKSLLQVDMPDISDILVAKCGRAMQWGMKGSALALWRWVLFAHALLAGA